MAMSWSPAGFVAACCGVVAGALVSAYALVRLGLYRHGVPGFGFLHVEWWGELSAHPAHADNLATLGFGLLLVIAGAVAAWRYRPRRRS